MTAMLTRIARSVFAPATQNDVNLGNSATLNAQIWLGQFPWRPTAAWAVVSALLATGLLTRRVELNWQTVALLLLLTDPLWGSIWRLAAGRAELLPLHTQVIKYQVWLPYQRKDSPAARLLGWDNAGVFPLLFRVALPSVVLTGALALVLGLPALGMTGIVVLVSVLGWISRRVLQISPALLHSIVTVALPWLLALILLGDKTNAFAWKLQIILIVLWAIHNWGEGRSIRSGDDWVGLGLLAVAEVGMVTLFILAQIPLWLAPLIILWLPAWLLIYQRQPVQRANFWWLLAMLVSALGLAQAL